MKTNNRFIAFLLAGILFFPAIVKADTNTEDTPAGVYLDKKVIENGTNNYTISLEAFVTGQEIIKHEPQPLDIALVLDASSSMRLNCPDYPARDNTAYKANTAALRGSGEDMGDPSKNKTWISEGTFVHYPYEGDYYPVHVGIHNDNGTKYYFMCFDVNGTRYYLSGTGDPVTAEPHNVTSSTGVIWTGVLYSKDTNERIKVLKSAVSTFLDLLNKDENKLAHNVAIVRFGNADYNNGTNLLAERNNSSEYSKTTLVSNFKDVSSSTNLSSLKTAVNNINMSGQGASTAADYGMNIAEALFNQTSIKSDGRPKVVVMFTDGEPNHGGDNFNADVATATVAKAKALKDDKVRIFTVGLFNTKYSDDSDVTKYLNAVSSNYPDAANYSVTVDKEHTDKGFSSQVTNGGALNAVFTSIAATTISGAADLGLTSSSTTVIDIVSNSFKLPDGASKDDILLYAAPCRGVASTGVEGTFEYTFGEKKLLSDIEEVDFSGVLPTVVDKTVSVTGFDFSKHFVGETVDGSTHTPRGYKLIIEFPIVIDPRNVGGASVATNDPESGLYCDLDGDGVQEIFAPFPVPHAKIPNIAVVKTGLHKGESATYNIYKIENGVRSQFPIVLVVTQNDDDPTTPCIARAKIQKPGRYEVEETSWCWAYDLLKRESVYTVNDEGKGSTDDETWHKLGYGSAEDGYKYPKPTVFGTQCPEGTTSIIRNVYEYTEDATYKGTVFKFENKVKAGTPAHGEASVNNVFAVPLSE